MTTSFVVVRNISEQQAKLTLEFAQYATNVESQRIMLQQARRIPANVGVDYTVDPALTGFMEQISETIAYPNRIEMAAIQHFGDIAYTQVLLDNREPTIAVAEMTNAISQTISSSKIVSQ